MKKIFSVITIVCTVFAAVAQQNNTTSPLTISGYAEVYHSFDFNKPKDHNKPAFIYSYARHNETTLNIGLLKAAYQKENVRANLALMAGTYTNANLAAEPGVLKNIFEANAGVKLSNKKDLWVDAGIFASHIGFESAIGKDCWNLTRSILAENSPYYQSGVKLSYTSLNKKWFISGLLLNGWQRIQRIDGNNTPAFGHQLTFKPNANIVLNSSSFIGNDKPDSVKQMRYFHNFYGQFKLNTLFDIIVGFDIGIEQKAKGSTSYNNWYAPVLIVKFSPNTKNNIAARLEYFKDKNGVIIYTGSPNGFNTWGYSINYDYLISPNIIWRVEGRMFTAKDAIFTRENKQVQTNIFLTTSLAISF